MPEPRDQGQAALYDDLAVVNNYTIESGVCILPLAQEPPTTTGELQSWSPVVKLQLHAPYRVRKVNYKADKQNNPPVMPSPTDKGVFLFVGGSIVIANVLNMTWNNYDWHMVVDYTFVENCVHRVDDGFVLGTIPVTSRMSVENAQIYQPTTQQGLVGAIASAGTDARVGYTLGTQIEPKLTATYNPLTGLVTAQGWGYNQASYLPGCFFNDELVNAGPTQGL